MNADHRSLRGRVAVAGVGETLYDAKPSISLGSSPASSQAARIARRHSTISGSGYYRHGKVLQWRRLE